jgi:single-strand DNA-binding protein
MMQKVIIIGYLGADPDVRYTNGGSTVANVSVATTEKWKDKETGENQERTEWHRVVFFGRLAEIVGEYLGKGSLVCVEGKLQTRKWQDKDGQERYTTEIVANEMKMLGGRNDSRADSAAQSNGANGRSQKPKARPRPPKPATAPAADMDDDIPF